MSEKKPIIVWKNGRQAKTDQSEYKMKLNQNKKSLSFFARLFNSKNKRRNKNLRTNYRPVIIAFCSAIFIGLVLGFIMLHMMKNMNGASSGAITPAANNYEENNDVTSTSSEFTYEQMNAFVIQAGVFSEEENAKEWNNTFIEASLKPVIWERENQYYILLGLANTMEEANQLLIKLKSDGFDMFVKEWSTEEKTLDLQMQEQEWLQSFQTTWLKTLKNQRDENIAVDEWVHLVQGSEMDTGELANLKATIDTYFSNEDESLNFSEDGEQILLESWREYEKVINGEYR